jgi:cytochrome c553
MRSVVSQVVLALTSVLVAAVLIAAGDPPPPWAYGFADAAPATPPAAAPGGGRAGGGGGAGGGRGAAPGAAAPAPADTSLKQIPGSTASFTLAQIRDAFGPADWFPGDHPTMPDIVAHGKRPDVRACSLCHYPNGKGRPENAGVAGLPVTYFIQTMNDFRNDARKSADARKANTNVMITIAKGMTDEEIKAAAEYFGAMKWTPWIKVVETNTVPKTRIAGGMFLRIEPEDKEPIGQRIIESPDDTERTETLRDPHSGFTAFVPVGSVKKGETLVTSGAGGKTTACAVCHGADLRGLGPVPGIAGRSPSYMVRQLYDMQQGIRKGVWSDLMKPVVAKLTNDDMLAIAAYTASK